MAGGHLEQLAGVALQDRLDRFARLRLAQELDEPPLRDEVQEFVAGADMMVEARNAHPQRLGDVADRRLVQADVEGRADYVVQAHLRRTSRPSCARAQI